jgi:hypothetical protein
MEAIKTACWDFTMIWFCRTDGKVAEFICRHLLAVLQVNIGVERPPVKVPVPRDVRHRPGLQWL